MIFAIIVEDLQALKALDTLATEQGLVPADFLQDLVNKTLKEFKGEPLESLPQVKEALRISQARVKELEELLPVKP